MTLAETASTFAEQLASDALIRASSATLGELPAALGLRLSDAATYLLNIPLLSEFQRAPYRERAAGEVPVSCLHELVLEAQSRSYGEALDPQQLDQWFWASKLHFYLTDTSFCDFPHVLGFLFSLGVLTAIGRRAGPSLGNFEQLLRRAGTAPVESLTRETLGVELSRSEFWHMAIDRIEQDLLRPERR